MQIYQPYFINLQLSNYSFIYISNYLVPISADDFVFKDEGRLEIYFEDKKSHLLVQNVTVKNRTFESDLIRKCF